MRPTHQPAVILLEADLRIPAGVHDFDAFRRWSHSEEFPARGRIDYLRGDVEVDLSPEDLTRHGIFKVAIAARLHGLVADRWLGWVYVDSTRIASPAAGLSAEPDVVVVLRDSLRSGRVRMVPSADQEEGRYIELEGAPDLVVEVVSKYSVKKDRERLPVLYALAGVPELWLADARGPALRFEILILDPDGAGKYVLQPAGSPPGKAARRRAAATSGEDASARIEASPWRFSPLLGRWFRLRRLVMPGNEVFCELDSAP